MRVHLELERDEWKYLTMQSSIGSYRTLQITINGRSFATWYRIDSYGDPDENYMKKLDEELARQFERMVEKVLADSLAKAPEGVDLLESKL